MIETYIGNTGQGKTLALADKVLSLVNRNIGWYKKTGKLRKIASNIPFSENLHEKIQNAIWRIELKKSSITEDQALTLFPDKQGIPNMITYWQDPEELIEMRDCDLIWDEVATYLDSSHWENLPLTFKRFLQQHRKKGIDIYGTSQRFGAVDVSYRSLVDHLYRCTKLIGSRNISATKPPVKHPWGIIWMKGLDPLTYDKPQDEQKHGIPFDFRVMLITKERCEVYDTLKELSGGDFPPLKHIERICGNPDCKFHRVVHY